MMGAVLSDYVMYYAVKYTNSTMRKIEILNARKGKSKFLICVDHVSTYYLDLIK
jgi:hypothetical protein